MCLRLWRRVGTETRQTTLEVISQPVKVKRFVLAASFLLKLTVGTSFTFQFFHFYKTISEGVSHDYIAPFCQLFVMATKYLCALHLMTGFTALQAIWPNNAKLVGRHMSILQSARPCGRSVCGRCENRDIQPLSHNFGSDHTFTPPPASTYHEHVCQLCMLANKLRPSEDELVVTQTGRRHARMRDRMRR
ncbi:unnamed protein product [Protopolystoma xenopodis]|uniref:Uncharacterized protein n=1 Tax=Protopolystoma xenopodis TaxID=117903 RepID=A0A3S5FCH6_9PLAT|nr:unnamed protein product [Protopolystoma xenopodis]